MTTDAMRHQTLGDLSPIALMTIDRRRNVLDLNPAAEALFKMSHRAIVDRPLSEVVYHDNPLFELIDRATRQAGDITAPSTPISGPSFPLRSICDVRIRSTENGAFVISLTDTPARDAGESVAGAAGFGRILGHEVKNPLAGIIGASQLLVRQGHSEQSELLNIIRDEARRIERLVNRLSAFELFSAPRLEPLNIHAVLDRVLASEGAALGRDVRFEREFDPSLPDISGDPDHLQQAFQNIIRNAAEAAMESTNAGRVIIRTSYAAGLSMKNAQLGAAMHRAIFVSVEDNGRGIPREKQATIFDVFQSSKSGARGLGLSIVSEVVTAHGGQIRLDSESGSTRFSVLLPIGGGNLNDG